MCSDRCASVPLQLSVATGNSWQPNAVSILGDELSMDEIGDFLTSFDQRTEIEATYRSHKLKGYILLLYCLFTFWCNKDVVGLIVYTILKKTASQFTQKYDTAKLFSTLIIIRNVSWTANQHIRMTSDGSCDTEDWSNDAENSALHHRNKSHFNVYSNRKQLL